MSLFLMIFSSGGTGGNTPAPTPTGTVQILAEGDSITNENYPTPGGTDSYPAQLMVRLGNRFSLTQHGYPGQNMDGYLSQNISTAIASIDATKDSRIAVVYLGTNDLKESGVVPVERYGKLFNICDQLRAAGADKIIVVPVLNRTDSYATAGTNDNRLRFNEIIRQNYPLFADEIAHVWEEPYIYEESATGDGYFFGRPDRDNLYGVHPTPLGAKVIAEEVAQAIARLTGDTLTPVSPYIEPTATPPAVAVSLSAATLTEGDLLTVSATPTVAGGRTVSEIQYLVDSKVVSTGTATSQTLNLAKGAHVVRVCVIDSAGDRVYSAAQNVTVNAAAGAAIVNLTVSARVVNQGQSITLTVAATPKSGRTVSYYDWAVVRGTQTLYVATNGNTTVTIPMNTAGGWEAKVTMTDSAGEHTQSDTIVLMVR